MNTITRLFITDRKLQIIRRKNNTKKSFTLYYKNHYFENNNKCQIDKTQ